MPRWGRANSGSIMSGEPVGGWVGGRWGWMGVDGVVHIHLWSSQLLRLIFAGCQLAASARKPKHSHRLASKCSSNYSRFEYVCIYSIFDKLAIKIRFDNRFDSDCMTPRVSMHCYNTKLLYCTVVHWHWVINVRFVF